MSNVGMKELIQVVNKLQDLFTTTGVNCGFELPRIAVVGGQSAGKSSVLENFVGKDFLPRGSGIVTRRPLILQFIFSPNEEYAEFDHVKGTRFYDFDEVRKEIEDETEKETGSNKGISNLPMKIKIISPNVLDLTLIDLPGITKVAVGDQPEDIEDQIRNMLLEYITPENTLILAVSPANQDLANSDALKLARKVDPLGNRTIGVITKLDLMDKGTNAREILENKHLPLKKGYIGIVNRSQDDINNKKDINASMEAEMEFFLDSPYKNMVDKMGTKYLQKFLNEQLGNHIRDKLPGIRSDLNKKLDKITEQLKEMGYFTQENKSSIYKLMAKFTQDIQSGIEGNSIDVSILEAKGGAIINATLYGEVLDLIKSAVLPQTKEEIKEICLGIANVRGYRNINYNPELAFDAIVLKQTARYKPPLTQSVIMIKNIVGDVVEESSKELERFPKLREEVLFLMSTRISKLEEDANNVLMNHVEAQMGFVNTRHPHYPKFCSTSPEKEDENIRIANANPSPNTLRRPNTPTTFYPGSKDANEVEVFSGKMTTLPAKFGKGKEVLWIVATKTSITLMDEKKTQIELKLALKDLQIEFKMGRQRQHFILIRSDGQILFKNESRLELCCPKDEAEPWMSAFKEADVYQERKDSISTVAETAKGFLGRFKKSSSVNKNEIIEEIIENNKDLAEDIKRRVNAYMKITQTTIQDMVPKYILCSLVNQTVKYVTGLPGLPGLLTDLLAKYPTNEEKEDLMRQSDSRDDEIKELVAVMNGTKEAVYILEQMSKQAKMVVTNSSY